MILSLLARCNNALNFVLLFKMKSLFYEPIEVIIGLAVASSAFLWTHWSSKINTREKENFYKF